MARSLVGHQDPANPQRHPHGWALVKHSDNMGKDTGVYYATAVMSALVNGELDSDVDNNSK